MFTASARRRWWPSRRPESSAAAFGDHALPTGGLSDDAPRDAARIALPMLSAVAERLRWVIEQEHTSPALREELETTLRELDDVVQSVWTRAVTEPLVSPSSTEAEGAT